MNQPHSKKSHPFLNLRLGAGLAAFAVLVLLSSMSHKQTPAPVKIRSGTMTTADEMLQELMKPRPEDIREMALENIERGLKEIKKAQEEERKRKPITSPQPVKITALRM